MNVDTNFNIPELTIDNTKWINPIYSSIIRFYGFNWIEEDKVFRRLPLNSIDEIQRVAPIINQLAEKTSGGQIHFWTNSKKLIIQAVIPEKVGLASMTAVSQGGFDCYVGSSYDTLKFFNSTRFELDKTKYQFTLFENEENLKLVVLNFPLYGGVKELVLGIDKDALIEKPKLLANGEKIVIYGTSITQGGCASRPGLSFTNILSRRLQCEFINLGFSGNAFGEIEIAKIISNMEKVKLFIIDYEANGGTNGKLEKTLENFILEIRKKHPNTAIAVMSRIKYLFDDLRPALGIRRAEIKKFQIDIVKKFKLLSDKNIYFIDGSKLLGKDYHEYTIDSIHPNDLGFMNIANRLEKRIKKILDL